MRDFGDALDVDDDPARIGEVLDEDRLALRRQRLAEILRLGRDRRNGRSSRAS